MEKILQARERLLPLDETAELLGVSVITLRREIVRGRLPIVKVGRRSLVHPMCPFWVLVGVALSAQALGMGGSRISMLAGFEPALLPGFVRRKRAGRLFRMLALIARH